MREDLERLIEERSRGLVICSTRADFQNEMDKKERWCIRYIRKCWMFGERDEPINDLIAEDTKPSQKEWK